MKPSGWFALSFKLGMDQNWGQCFGQDGKSQKVQVTLMSCHIMEENSLPMVEIGVRRKTLGVNLGAAI